MKEGFIRSLMGDFIARRDFTPLKDEAGNIVTGGIVSILTKQSFGSLVILELIDADRLSAGEISALLEGSAGRLDGINAAQCFVFEVFVFDGAPGAEKLPVINEGQLHGTVEKKYVKCLSVDLGAGAVAKCYDTSVPDFAISRTIGERLAKGEAGARYEGGLEELVRKKEDERKIRFSANSSFLTYGLIAVNIVVYGLLYLYSLQSGKSYDQLLSVFGAKVNSNIMNGEYWRFITPVFLHANPVHLLINCYSLYAVGVTVEKMFGHLRFSAIYLFAGLLGNLFSFMFSVNPAVGASGAIFGLLGALVYFGLERPALFKAYFGYGVITTIAVNLVYGFSKSGIDNYAHMGGLLGGFLAAGAVKARTVGKWYLNRLLYILLALVIGTGGLLYGFTNGNNFALGKLDDVQALIDDKNYGKAEETVEAILAAGPRDRDVASGVLRTAIYVEAVSGKLEESLQHAQRLIEVDPPSGHYFTGLVYYDMKRYEDSKRELLKAKELKAGFSNIDEILNSLEGLASE